MSSTMFGIRSPSIAPILFIPLFVIACGNSSDDSPGEGSGQGGKTPAATGGGTATSGKAGSSHVTAAGGAMGALSAKGGAGGTAKGETRATGGASNATSGASAQGGKSVSSKAAGGSANETSAGGKNTSGSKPAGGARPTSNGATGGITAPSAGGTSAAIAAGGKSSSGGASGAAVGGDATGGGSSPSSCVPVSGADKSGAVNINLATVYQNISGYGGINVPGWIDDLTEAQTETAFGNGSGQIGMSILRVRIPYDETKFKLEVPTAKHAVALGAKVFATPWTPPAKLKTNNNTVGGRLSAANYGAYAEHLLSFRDYMEENGVPIYAISVQNEPDITVDYESCFWNSSEFISWLKAHGSKFGETKLIAAESFKFDRSITDPILNDAAASAQIDIVGGHIYGSGLADYPLARNKGKEIWMTEHYTESNNSANAWPLALDVGKEIHNCMASNFSAYIWWYIRRSYGPITEDGKVSKRGYLMAQYSKFVRPGFVRVAASNPSNGGVMVTAYKKDSQVVVVAVNTSSSSQKVTLNVRNGCVSRLAKYTTSSSKNLSADEAVTLTSNTASVSLDGQSVTTFVSE
ncbi:MAG TPA: hypothetical protein VKP30_14220 [Polyangiaceae bacterium]|nr:hypothetical protein [Polyangiaceae bacterium]